jgi:predicted nucleotidyltransferase
MINGSSFQKDQRSDMSVGSDIDILVITTAVGTESKLLDLNHKIKEKTKVPVEFVPISLEMAQAGEHNIDFFYKQYLETYCMDGIIGNNPLEAIAPREE